MTASLELAAIISKSSASSRNQSRHSRGKLSGAGSVRIRAAQHRATSVSEWAISGSIADIDYAQLIKLNGGHVEPGRERYAPSKRIGSVPCVINGDPDPGLICTSHIEHSNLSMRPFMRRLTRLPLGFSKKLANLKRAVALYFAYYNFCRVHGTHRITPAMEAGLSDHV